ncbi:histone-like nucleoid-structuring protein Lsr2 [Kitasatospora sp. KL5]|uniref:histone-like nucleoid-structuring protein Lsr2 n=1 Tax=Kitasatospora sp. KL5 TaxID=3425125 RepID=UPI003D6F999B
MAQRVQVILEDDLDGGSADETVMFALDGVAYEIDLKSDNAEKLRDLLAPYVEKGRKQSGRIAGSRRSSTGGRSTGRSAASGADTAKIRSWAKENGLEINDRGRVPSDIKAQYDKAHAS